MTTTTQYSLDDVTKIKQQGFTFDLPKQTQELIMSLSKLVGSPDYIKTPIFQKKKTDSEPDWDLIKQFKPTAKVERTDNEELIQKVKVSLNKMTDKNYDTMRNQLIENLDKLESTELFESVNNIIFNIVSSNRFYSKVYANLYKELLESPTTGKMFQERLDNEIDSYLKRYLEIKVVNANDDYEAFCEANKENERRKAMTEFFIHLMIMGIIDSNKIVNIHDKLCELTLEHKFSEEHKQTIIEISENIYIIVKTGGSAFKESGHLDTMIDKVRAISNLKVKQHPGLSNKSSFKFMDVTDIKI